MALSGGRKIALIIEASGPCPARAFGGIGIGIVGGSAIFLKIDAFAVRVAGVEGEFSIFLPFDCRTKVW